MQPNYVCKKSVLATISIWRILFFWLIIPLIVQIVKCVNAASQVIEFYNDKVVIKSGVLNKNEKQCIFLGVRSVSIHQTLMGRLFNYGDVNVDCVGKWDVDTTNIKRPKEFKAYLESRLSTSGINTIVTE